MTSSTFNEDELRARIVALAKTYLGTPWRHQGRTKLGIDCAGLPIVIGRELGLHAFSDDINYQRLSIGAALFAPFEEHCIRLSNLAELKPGDMLIFKDPVFPQHIGLMSSNGNVIHAKLSRRKVVEEPLVGDLKSRLLRGYKFKVFGR